MSNTFEYIAAARYPITNGTQSKNEILQLRSDYIAGLRECKLRPVYFARTAAGDIPCLCEPLTTDDSKGWQTVKHAYVKKTRPSKREYTEIYDTKDY